MKTQSPRFMWVSRSVVLAVMLAMVGQAGETFFAKGMYEVGFTGGYAKLDISGFDVHLLMGMGDVSYFVTDNLSLGVSVAGGYIADAGDMPFDGNLLGLEANARYHFPIFCRALPYVGLHAGYMRAELDDVSGDGIEYGAHAGVKFPVTANVFFDTQIRYTRADSSDMEMEADILMALFGFRYYFGEGADMNAQAAAEPRPFAAGDVELSAMGGYMFGSLADDNSSEDFEGHIILATGQMAYWLTDAITVGIGALGMYIPQAGDAGDMMGDDDAMLVGAELRGNYHFVNFGSFVPYVGLHGGAAYAVLGDTDSQTAFEYGAQVGFKYLLTDTVFIDTQVRHTRFDFDESDMNIDANATLAMVGLGFRL